MIDHPTPDAPLRIGTRGSALALAQAHETRARLMAAHALPEDAFRIVVIKTTGDRVLDRPLREIGGKGLFTREIEDALLDAELSWLDGLLDRIRRGELRWDLAADMTDARYRAQREAARR